MFPILHDPIIRAVPWASIQPHEKQAERNHYQSLKRLAERGGLSVVEAVVIMLDKPFPRSISDAQIPEYRHVLMRLVRDFEAGRRALENGGAK
jgi:hypothetical protein